VSFSFIVLHIDHTILDGGSVAMTLLPVLLDVAGDGHNDPTTMFKNLKPFTSWQRTVMNVQGFFLMPLAFYRAVFSGNSARDGDLNPLHSQTGKMEGK
jgi:hypothetical protein